MCFHSKKETLYTTIVKMGQVKTRIDAIVLLKWTRGDNIIKHHGVGAMTIVLRIQMRVSMYVIVVCSSFFAIGESFFGLVVKMVPYILLHCHFSPPFSPFNSSLSVIEMQWREASL